MGCPITGGYIGAAVPAAFPLPPATKPLSLYVNLGNGQPAKSFSSWTTQTINTHFSWMQPYGFDVTAMQRFGKIDPQKDGIANKVMAAAQTYGRKVYVMWRRRGPVITHGNYTMAQLAARGVPNDWASSVRVPAGRTLIMYAGDNFTGTSWTRTADTPNFTTLSPNANDQVSSCRVQ